jgi:hypothetical protein
MGSILSGVVLLSLMELLVTTGSPHVDGLFAIPAKVAAWFIDPSVAGLPAPKSKAPAAVTPTAPTTAVASTTPKARAQTAGQSAAPRQIVNT